MKQTEYSRDVHIRVRETERAHLDKRAEECGIKNSEYIRRLIQNDMGKNVKSISKEQRLLQNRYITEISKIGVNINQIVKDYNSYFYDPAEKRQLFILMEEIKKILNQAFR